MVRRQVNRVDACRDIRQWHQVLAIEVVDPRELELPNVGYLTVWLLKTWWVTIAGKTSAGPSPILIVTSHRPQPGVRR